MEKILIITEKVNQFGVWMGGALMFLISGLIGVEVLLRKLFAISIGGADELSSYVLAISCSWAFGFSLLRKAHIRIDILHARLPAVLRAGLDILSLLIFLLYLCPLVYYASLVFSTSFARQSTANTPLQTPLWIPQGAWLAGLIVFLLTIVVLLVATTARLYGKDLAGASRLCGTATLEEEVEEESGIQMGGAEEGVKS